MKKMLVLLVVLLMVGCEAKESEMPKQIKETLKQEQQVDEPKEEIKEQPKEDVKGEPKKEVKQVEKELPKKEEAKKKEQNDNIDPETGLANIKDGTHLEEEAKKQEEEGIIEPEEEVIEPEEDYNEEDDEDWIREYGNTDEIDDYSEEYE